MTPTISEKKHHFRKSYFFPKMSIFFFFYVFSHFFSIFFFGVGKKTWYSFDAENWYLSIGAKIKTTGALQPIHWINYKNIPGSFFFVPKCHWSLELLRNAELGGSSLSILISFLELRGFEKIYQLIHILEFLPPLVTAPRRRLKFSPAFL